MTTAGPSKYDIMRISFGKYTWWPSLQLVDFIPKGKQKPIQVASLNVNKNNEREALKIAVKHLTHQLSIEEFADKLLREENLGITDYWLE